MMSRALELERFYIGSHWSQLASHIWMHYRSTIRISYINKLHPSTERVLCDSSGLSSLSTLKTCWAIDARWGDGNGTVIRLYQNWVSHVVYIGGKNNEIQVVNEILRNFNRFSHDFPRTRRWLFYEVVGERWQIDLWHFELYQSRQTICILYSSSSLQNESNFVVEE